MNTINVVGRVGREPESRQANGKTVCNFSVAVSHGRDKTSWFNVTAWGKTAETAVQYLRKGDLVGVSGQHIEESWEKDGEIRKKWVLDASRIHLMPKAVNDRAGRTDDDMPF